MQTSVLIAGGSGFVGRFLVEYLLSAGYSVSVLTRHRGRVSGLFPRTVEVLEWGELLCKRSEALEFDCLINLSGESIAGGLWTKKKKEKILQSRLIPLESIDLALREGTLRFKSLLNASAVGFYGDRNDELLTEDSPGGEGFLAEVCRKWEFAALKIEAYGIRVVCMRFGIVFGSGGGALSFMSLPYRLYMGGVPGSGKQWLSWIHIADLAAAVDFLVKNTVISGAVNVCAPNPVQAADFCRIMSNVLKSPSWMPLPEFLLKMLPGGMSEFILNSQRVYPGKLVSQNHNFSFSDLEVVLSGLLNSSQ
jgi:uncharacterized protein (TIGR01777 family)